MKAKIRGRSHSLIYLILLTSCLPFTVALYFLALIIRSILRTSTINKVGGINILLTGGKMTKSLQLARLLNRAGHKVLLSETKSLDVQAISIRSTSISFSLSDMSEGYDAYFSDIQKIVEKRNVDLIIPVASQKLFFDSEVKHSLKKQCEFFTLIKVKLNY